MTHSGIGPPPPPTIMDSTFRRLTIITQMGQPPSSLASPCATAAPVAVLPQLSQMSSFHTCVVQAMVRANATITITSVTDIAAFLTCLTSTLPVRMT